MWLNFEKNKIWDIALEGHMESEHDGRKREFWEFYYKSV